MSLLGTGASIAGGVFIGLVFWLCGLLFTTTTTTASIPSYSLGTMIALGMFGGGVGSLVSRTIYIYIYTTYI